MTVGRDTRQFMVSCELPTNATLNVEAKDDLGKWVARFDSATDDLLAALNFLDRPILAQTGADLIVVIVSLLESFGIDTDAVLQIIHQSNLSRLDENGHPYEVDANNHVGRGPDYVDPYPLIKEVVS